MLGLVCDMDPLRLDVPARDVTGSAFIRQRRLFVLQIA
jgi:hypothetical protein